jgi:8-oxo-dGTP pyrophosphatase MutT (NUDIX family)
MSNSPYMVATVAAIIERHGTDEIEVFFQIRNKSSMTSYGTLEFPGGRIQAGEDVFSALKREVREETGLSLVRIKPNIVTNVKGLHDRVGYAFTPFCCNSYNGSPAIGFIFLCEAEGEPNTSSSEATHPQWIPLSEIRRLIKEEPHRFFYYYLGALQYYLEQRA